jgi:hypothetical protein
VKNWARTSTAFLLMTIIACMFFPVAATADNPPKTVSPDALEIAVGPGTTGSDNLPARHLLVTGKTLVADVSMSPSWYIANKGNTFHIGWYNGSTTSVKTTLKSGSFDESGGFGHYLQVYADQLVQRVTVTLDNGSTFAGAGGANFNLEFAVPAGAKWVRTIDIAYDSGQAEPLHFIWNLSPAKPVAKFQVSSVKIDYSPWQAAMVEASSALKVAEGYFNDMQAKFVAAQGRIPPKQQEARRARDALAAARKNELDAARKAAATGSSEAKKTPQYRMLEKQIATDNKHLSQLWNSIEIAKKSKSDITNALDAFDRLKAKIAIETATLAKLDAQLGLDSDRLAAEKAAEAAADIRRRAEIDYGAALSGVATAQRGEDDAWEHLKSASDAVDAARVGLDKLEAKGTPLVTYIRLDDQDGRVYQADWWDPKELLDYLNDEIPRLESIFAQSADERMAARADMFAANNDTIAAGERLRMGIYKSAGAQTSIELLARGYDIFKAVAEDGIAGAVGEVAKEVVEAVVFEPIKFYEPEIAEKVKPQGDFREVNALWELAKDSAEGTYEQVQETGQSSLTTDLIGDVAVKEYIAHHDFSKYLAAIGKVKVVGKLANGGRLVEGKGLNDAIEFFEKFREARAEAKKAWDGLVFRKFADEGTVTGVARLKKTMIGKKLYGFGVDLLKDAAVESAKKQVGDWLEGGPLSDYIKAEEKSQSLSASFLAGSAAYYKIQDELAKRREERATALKVYDPNTNMKVTESKTFNGNDTIAIELNDRDGAIMPSQTRHFTVTLGGQTADLVPGASLAFRVPAKNLSADAKGGVALSIVVGP